MSSLSLSLRSKLSLLIRIDDRGLWPPRNAYGPRLEVVLGVAGATRERGCVEGVDGEFHDILGLLRPWRLGCPNASMEAGRGGNSNTQITGPGLVQNWYKGLDYLYITIQII